MLKILETEINFDFCDVDNVEKYEIALEEYMKELEQLKTFEGKDSVALSKICNIVYKFFNSIVGEGTAQKIFMNKRNFAQCLEAMGQIIKAKEDSLKNVNEIIDKYIPKEG